jgi:hypothetical protein
LFGFFYSATSKNLEKQDAVQRDKSAHSMCIRDTPSLLYFENHCEEI